MKTIITLLLGLFSFFTIIAQDEIKMEDYVYVTNIKSVSLSPNGSMLDGAVTYLGSGVNLFLTFDDMDADQKDYSYDIIHCDRNWVPSDLLKQEYIDGFVDERIDNFQFSRGTFIPYTNYSLTIPNRDASIILSGNYVLVVYDGDDVEDRFPVFTRRFVVVDPKVSIVADARKPMDVILSNTHQTFDIYVNYDDFQIVDPMVNLSVSINQNGNWFNSIDNMTPRTVLGNKVIIDNTNKVIFPGLKEFRSCDIRSFDVVSNDIHSLELTDRGTNVLLKLGEQRSFGTYSTYADADGSFVLQTKDQNSSSTGGDYGNVIFTLNIPERDQDVYVTGKFTDWQIDETYKMTYDYNREIYFAEIEMKQGFYDYMFAVDDDGVLDPVPIEGSTYQAQNYYQVFVFLREPGDRYDRVIGYGKLVSGF